MKKLIKSVISVLMAELNDGMTNIMTNAPVLMNDVYASAMAGTSQIGYTKEEQEIMHSYNLRLQIQESV